MNGHGYGSNGRGSGRNGNGRGNGNGRANGNGRNGNGRGSNGSRGGNGNGRGRPAPRAHEWREDPPGLQPPAPTGAQRGERSQQSNPGKATALTLTIFTPGLPRTAPLAFF